MQNSKYKNILICRTDRIGDVVLTLPLIEVLRRESPFARITFLARSYTQDIVQGQAGLDSVVLYDQPEERKPFFSMLSELRRAQYDLAIVAFPRFRVALLLWLARIQTRIGSGYRWYSFLFNKRVYEHRKTAEKHELGFNLSLPRELGYRIPSDVRPTISIPAKARDAASAERERLGITGRDTVAILHPGSGGSARDWSTHNFGHLAIELNSLGWKVVVTGATGEEKLADEVIEISAGVAQSSVGRLSLKELGAFIESVDLFVSNSTGPLHIAAAVGTPVIGFYPPILACSPNRWGPVTDAKVVFVPERANCEMCKGGPCRASVCMDQIIVGKVVEAAEKLVPVHKSGSKRKSPVDA